MAQLHCFWLNTYRLVFLLILLTMGIGQATAAEPINTLEKSLFRYKPNGIAIRGFDTVAYFTQGMPVMGSGDFSTEWMGATWHFSTQDHLDLFLEQPESYAPQYGGYCAYGVSQGYLVKIEPDQWTIVQDKLYLNYDKEVQATWVKDIPGYIKKADADYSDLLQSD